MDEFKENTNIEDEKDGLKDVFEKAAKHSKAFAEDVHLKENVDEFYAKVKEAATVLGKKVGEVAQDEEVRERFKELTDPIVKSAKNLSEQVNKNDRVKKVVDSVKEGVGEGVEFVSEKTNEFFEREDVQKNLEKAKDKTIEWADKGVDKLKGWLKPAAEDADDEKKESE